ncbi:MAG: umuD protein [Bacteroidales bacterium]|nr:umuD protein [Bacteroidales bacterium]MDE6147320.1 umuD protein [Bacteroidales bacterium]
MWTDEKNSVAEIIDLNKELVVHPAATFYGRVTGNSMSDAGVAKGDVLVIDKSLDARDGDLAVCFLDGEFMLRRVERTEDGLRLLTANPDCPGTEIAEDADFTLWGIVTYVIKKVR